MKDLVIPGSMGDYHPDGVNASRVRRDALIVAEATKPVPNEPILKVNLHFAGQDHMPGHNHSAPTKPDSNPVAGSEFIQTPKLKVLG